MTDTELAVSAADNVSAALLSYRKRHPVRQTKPSVIEQLANDPTEGALILALHYIGRVLVRAGGADAASGGWAHTT
jgi:hypothetical protein